MRQFFLKQRFLFLFFFSIHPFFHFAQMSPNWTPPIDIPILLSGTFGEFRSNHFHAGLDIKTQGREGLAVKSIQGGWINRIRVSTSGYGKAIYIQHFDSTTSVYAHLKKFAPKIEAFIKEKQYQKESYTIQLFPKSEELKIEQGELIGYSGNTGGSYGPHLHFEVRKTSNQNPINPMSYPLEIKDTQRPQIQNFYLYDGLHPDSKRKEFPLIKKNDSVYTTAGIHQGGKINVGLRLFDRQDLSYNKNGIYKGIVRLNGVPQFELKMDQLSFNDSNYINLLIDYEEYAQKRRRIQRFALHPELQVSFLDSTGSSGEMELEEGKSYQILVEISDYNGNNSYIEAYITGTEATQTAPDNKDWIDPSLDYLFDYEDKSVYFPPQSFYNPLPLTVENKDNRLVVDKNRYPLRKPFEVRFKISGGDSLQQKQSFIALLKDKDKPVFFSNHQKNGSWIGKSKTLGTFTLSRDSIAPQIKPLNFKQGQWLSTYNYLRIQLKDDFSGIKSYRGEINGKWVLLEYEPKKNLLIYNFEDLKFESGLHQLIIEAEDQVGNQAQLKVDFYRKNTD